MDTNIFADVLTTLTMKALGHAEGRREQRKKLHLCKRKEKGGEGGMDSFTLFKGVGLAVGWGWGKNVLDLRFSHFVASPPRIFFSGLVFIL